MEFKSPQKVLLQDKLSTEKQMLLEQMKRTSSALGARAKEEEEQKEKREKNQQALAWLETTFPNCFNRKNPKPLKRHIEIDIIPCLPEAISKSRLRQALRVYTSQSAYHKAVVEGEYRYNLEGQQEEALEASHKEFSKTFLRQKQKVSKKKVKQVFSPFRVGPPRKFP